MLKCDFNKVAKQLRLNRCLTFKNIVTEQNKNLPDHLFFSRL